MTRKTHKTALVVIPPAAAWPPMQAIRRVHDRQYRRWMPHITLIYPFRPTAEFPALCQTLTPVCNRVAPFEIALGTFRFFEHSHRSCTIWLAPDPPEPLIQLQTELWHLVPDCSEVRDFPGGFTPHLSVGQAPGRKAALARVKECRNRGAPWSSRCPRSLSSRETIPRTMSSGWKTCYRWGADGRRACIGTCSEVKGVSGGEQSWAKGKGLQR